MAEINSKQFSRTLRRWIYAKGYDTIYAFIRETGIESTRVYAHAAGKHLPSLTTALELARALGITVEQLVNGPEGEEHAGPQDCHTSGTSA